MRGGNEKGLVWVGLMMPVEVTSAEGDLVCVVRDLNRCYPDSRKCVRQERQTERQTVETDTQADRE